MNHHPRLSNNKISISFLDISPELKFICPTSNWTLLLGCPTAYCAKMDTLLLSLTSNLLLFQYYLSFYLSLGLVPSSIYPPKQTPNSLPQHSSLFPITRSFLKFKFLSFKCVYCLYSIYQILYSYIYFCNFLKIHFYDYSNNMSPITL